MGKNNSMKINRRVFTIASGQSVSEIQKLNATEIVHAIEMPSQWTAAALSFLAGTVNTSLNSYYRNGNEIALSVAANMFHEFDQIGYLAAAKYIQLRSGTAATPVNQGASRAIVVVTLELD